MTLLYTDTHSSYDEIKSTTVFVLPRTDVLPLRTGYLYQAFAAAPRPVALRAQKSKTRPPEGSML